MSDSRTPAKPNLQNPPPIPPRPKSALKSKLTSSTPQATHKRNKSDPSPSPSKKSEQRKYVRIDALSPAKKTLLPRPLRLDMTEDLKLESGSSSSPPSPLTPKPTNVKSIVANNQQLSFSGRVAALIVAYDAYCHNPNPTTLQLYEQEITSFGFSCPQNPIRKNESDEEWQERMELHQEELISHPEFYHRHRNILREAKSKNLDEKQSGSLTRTSALQQEMPTSQVTDQALSATVAVTLPQQQPNLQRPSEATSAEQKTQSISEFAFDIPPQQMINEAHSINRVSASPEMKIPVAHTYGVKPAKTQQSNGGFWRCCFCKNEEEEGDDDRRYTQLPDGPVAKQKR